MYCMLDNIVFIMYCMLDNIVFIMYCMLDNIVFIMYCMLERTKNIFLNEQKVGMLLQKKYRYKRSRDK